MQNSKYLKLDPHQTSLSLSDQQLQQLLTRYQQLSPKDPNKPISSQQFYTLLEEQGYYICQRLKNKVLSIIDIHHIYSLSFQSCCIIIDQLQKGDLQLNDQEHVDAFIALGGSPDLTGYIYLNQIIQTIQNEFQLDFDLSHVLTELNTIDDQIDFQTFCNFFDSDTDFDDQNSLVPKISLRSIFSFFGRTNNSFSTNQSDGFKVNYQDFQKFCKKMRYE